MVKATTLLTLLAALSIAGATSAKPAAVESAAVHHAPPPAAIAHAPLRVRAQIDHPHTIKRVLLVYRTPKDPLYREVPFLRASDSYVAELPGTFVEYPSVSYTIEVEGHDDKRWSAYATRAEPHVIDVPTDLDDAREDALLARCGGRRSVVATSGELVSFGRSEARAGGDDVLDHWYRIEASYTYRPLHHVMEFGVRTGMVRGMSPVPNVDRTSDKVGLNYGAPFVVVRFADELHVEAHFLTSVTEIGFSTGVGGAFHIGDYFGTKFVIGFETVATFGTRGFTRLDLVRSRLRVSPIVEVTDMPHADRPGVRLLTEFAFDLGEGLFVALRGGYQARDFSSGGPGGGVTFAYAF